MILVYNFLSFLPFFATFHFPFHPSPSSLPDDTRFLFSHPALFLFCPPSITSPLLSVLLLHSLPCHPISSPLLPSSSYSFPSFPLLPFFLPIFPSPPLVPLHGRAASVWACICCRFCSGSAMLLCFLFVLFHMCGRLNENQTTRKFGFKTKITVLTKHLVEQRRSGRSRHFV